MSAFAPHAADRAAVERRGWGWRRGEVRTPDYCDLVEVEVLGKDDELIAHVYGRDHIEAHCNAKLMRGAPVLLDAVRGVLQEVARGKAVLPSHLRALLAEAYRWATDSSAVTDAEREVVIARAENPTQVLGGKR